MSSNGNEKGRPNATGRPFENFGRWPVRRSPIWGSAAEGCLYESVLRTVPTPLSNMSLDTGPPPFVVAIKGSVPQILRMSKYFFTNLVVTHQIWDQRRRIEVEIGPMRTSQQEGQFPTVESLWPSLLHPLQLAQPSWSISPQTRKVQTLRSSDQGWPDAPS